MPKRKRKDEETAAKAKKRVPFTAPKNAATKAMYEATSIHRFHQSLVLNLDNGSVARNASSSPLLRMPLEIREKIWAEVLGGELIHIEYIDIWRHLVCQHDSPDGEMAKHWAAENVHLRCDRELAGKISATQEQLGHNSMHLTALRVCRQMYIEANNVLWSTNTFSFTDDAIFVLFMNVRTTYQIRSLRRLRLQLDWSWGEYSWKRVLGITLIRSLTGLRSLRLQITHTTTAASYQEANARGNELGLFQIRQRDFVHRMAILPWTDVDVEVFPSNRPQWSHTVALWTVEDRTEYAEGIRKILLDPKGAEIFAQKQREERERSKER